MGRKKKPLATRRDEAMPQKKRSIVKRKRKTIIMIKGRKSRGKQKTMANAFGQRKMPKMSK